MDAVTCTYYLSCKFLPGILCDQLFCIVTANVASVANDPYVEMSHCICCRC